MNVTPPERRLRMIHLLLAGFSARQTAQRAGIKHTATIIRYMRLMKLERTRGHRSPIRYRHKNQCKEWWQEHAVGVQRYDPIAVMALQREALAEMGGPEHFDWQQGKRTMRAIRRLLKERTNRQSQ